MLRFLHACILFARHQSWQPIPEWTNDDARAWVAFMNSPAGLKLNLIIQNTIMEAGARASQKATPFDCGWACGYRGLVANLNALTAVGPEPDATGEAAQGGGLLDHLTP